MNRNSRRDSRRKSSIILNPEIHLRLDKPTNVQFLKLLIAGMIHPVIWLLSK